MLLGSERAWVVHGADGIDEISTTGHTKVSECRGGAVHTFYVHPSDFGVTKAVPADLRGGDASANAAIVSSILDGKQGPPRDVVLLNAAAAIAAGGLAADLKEGLERARESIASGKALAALDTLRQVSNR